MKIAPIVLATAAVVSLIVGGRTLRGSRDVPPERMEASAHAGMEMASSTVSMLPTEAEAKNLLNTMRRHREWVAVPFGRGRVFAFVVYPERSNRAPVVVLTAPNQAAGDWVRAAADQVAASGFIAVVPDVLTGMGPNGGDTESFREPADVSHALNRLGSRQIATRTEAVRSYAVALPAANGMSASLDLDAQSRKISTSVNVPPVGIAHAQFPLQADAWPEVMSFLTRETHDKRQFEANNDEHSFHFAMLAQMAENSAEVGRQGAPGANTSYAQKRPDLPAAFYTAKATLAASKLQHEWVDIPVGNVKVHTWVEFPAGNGKAGVVIVMQHGAGMDDWVRAVADQLAQSGFIAVAADVWSGTGPDGGGLDSFEFLDDAIRAGGKVTQDEIIERYKAARQWALKLPRASGKTASIGFCMGGGHSFRFAGEVPELNAAAVFYGTPPDEPTMAKINAPVLAFYGENDARVTATVAPATAAMKKLGKMYEPHVYPKATHSFALFQEAGGNPAAINDAWPRVIELFRKQLMVSERRVN